MEAKFHIIREMIDALDLCLCRILAVVDELEGAALITQTTEMPMKLCSATRLPRFGTSL